MTSRAILATVILRRAADAIEQRAKEYRGQGDMFEDIASESGLETHQVFDVLMAVKSVRLEANPEHKDSLIDLIAYHALSKAYEHKEAGERLVRDDHFITICEEKKA